MIALTLIHGWGVNAHIFNDFQQKLPENWVIHTPDLIGHGSQTLPIPFSIHAAADNIAAQQSSPGYLLGWSLGSQVVLQLAARYPQTVRGIILVSGFAKLRASADYPQGINNVLLEKMLGFFQQDYAKYVRQFLELQLIATPERRPLIKQILPDLVRHGTPQALHNALNALESADIRPMLPEIQSPALIICGNKDSVTPPRMSEYLAQHLPNARLHQIDKAAHAPFLSHAEQCAALIKRFIEQCEQR